MNTAFTLCVESHFVAAMAITSISGPCSQLHGHTYQVKVLVGGETLDAHGMLIDHHAVRAMLQRIIEPLDHQYLNDLPMFSAISPSAENIARHIFHTMEAALSEHSVNVQEVHIAENPYVNISYRGQ